MFCVDRATFDPPVAVALLPMRSFTLSLPALLAAPIGDKKHRRGLAGTMFSKVRLDSLSDGISLVIAAVGLRLVFITPHLEQGDHLRHRQVSVVAADGLIAACDCAEFCQSAVGVLNLPDRCSGGGAPGGSA